jgi:hypothetical protein
MDSIRKATISASYISNQIASDSASNLTLNNAIGVCADQKENEIDVKSRFSIPKSQSNISNRYQSNATAFNCSEHSDLPIDKNEIANRDELQIEEKILQKESQVSYISSMLEERQIKKTATRNDNPILCGLQNLGNTCYMLITN